MWLLSINIHQVCLLSNGSLRWNNTCIFCVVGRNPLDAKRNEGLGISVFGWKSPINIMTIVGSIVAAVCFCCCRNFIYYSYKSYPPRVCFGCIWVAMQWNGDCFIYVFKLWIYSFIRQCRKQLQILSVPLWWHRRISIQIVSISALLLLRYTHFYCACVAMRVISASHIVSLYFSIQFLVLSFEFIKLSQIGSNDKRTHSYENVW